MKPYVHHHRNCSHVSEGDGSGVGSAVVGSDDGVVESVGVEDSPLVGVGAEPTGADWASLLLLGEAVGDGEPGLSDADGDADPDGDAASDDS